jgi:hypothetical protein
LVRIVRNGGSWRILLLRVPHGVVSGESLGKAVDILMKFVPGASESELEMTASSTDLSSVYVSGEPSFFLPQQPSSRYQALD